MRNLRSQAFTKKKNNTIGRIKPKGGCKKHPKHNQSPGVCSLCLSEKLVQLSSFSTHRKTLNVANDLSSNSSSSYVSSLSSSYVSSCASPLKCFSFNSYGKSSSLSMFLVSGQNEIIQNKSFGRRKCEDGVEHENKRCGFWFNLFHAKRKRIEEKGHAIKAPSLSSALAFATPENSAITYIINKIKCKGHSCSPMLRYDLFCDLTVYIVLYAQM
ncbi:hypothetical protein RYX36_006937 [Vicia faba]